MPRWTLPSPAWPHPAIHASYSDAERGHPVHEVGDLGPGNDDVDDVVGAARLGHPERLLTGLDQLLAAAAGRTNAHWPGRDRVF